MPKAIFGKAREWEKEPLRFRTNGTDLAPLARQVSRDEGITEQEWKSKSRSTKISKARRLFCQLSVVKMGYPRAQVARLFRVSTSTVVRAAHSEALPEVGNYLYVNSATTCPFIQSDYFFFSCFGKFIFS